MPYCFDFTFNFFYIWLMSLRKKKQPKERRNGKEREDVAGILVCVHVGDAGGICPAGRGFWVCLAQHRVGIFSSSRDGVGAKVLSGSSLCVCIPWRAVHASVPAHRH